MSELLVEIFESKAHERGLRAKRDIKPGELLFRDKPFSFILYHNVPLSDNYCDQCFAEKGKNLLRCSGCKLVRYCNKMCQRAAWAEHKDECKSFIRANENGLPTLEDQWRLLAKIRWKQKPMVDNPLMSHTDADGFPTIPDELAKNNDKWEPEKQKKFENGVIQVCHFMTIGYIKNVDNMRELCGVMQTNCVEISDGELRNIGYGLYLRVALMNHACDFNCVATFSGTTVDIRATKEIKMGEECFMSYTEVYKSTEERCNIISTTWYFTCTCTLCKDKDRDAEICAFKCQSKGCFSSAPVPYYYMDEETDPTCKVTCPSCSWSERGKKILDKQEFTVGKMHQNKAIIQKCLKTPEMFEWEVIRVLSETNLSVGEDFLDPQNHRMVENMEWAMDACINLDILDKALKYGLQLLESYRKFYPTYHPATGLQCMRVGKIQLYLQQLPAARKTLQQAHHIIHVTHGDEHSLMKTLKELLFSCEEEMRVKRMQSIIEVEAVD